MTLLLGFLNPFLYYLILFNAYDRLDAQQAQPINMIWPIVLAVLAIPILKQRMTLPSLLALLLSFTGVFFISTKGSFYALHTVDIIGVLLALASAFIWAVFWLLSVRDKRGEVAKLFLSFLIGFLLIALSIPFIEGFMIPSWEGLIGSIYVGVFEMGITFIFWLKALSLTRSTARISNFIFLSPFLSLVFIHFILEEPIYWSTFVGLILIVSGIFMQQLKTNSITNTSHLVVGITGGYAAGKSTVTRLFVEHDFLTIDVDEVGHQALELQKSQIIGTFGDAICNEYGRIDRKALGKRVFSDPQALQTLNRILHPVMYNLVAQQLKQIGSQLVVIDAALLFTIGLDRLCDHIIGVTVPLEVARERGVNRDHRSPEEIDGILQAQQNFSQLIQKNADTHIENVGSLDDLTNQVIPLIQTLKSNHGF